MILHVGACVWTTVAIRSLLERVPCIETVGGTVAFRYRRPRKARAIVGRNCSHKFCSACSVCSSPRSPLYFPPFCDVDIGNVDLTRRMELLHDSELLDGDGEFLGSRFEREREIERRMEGEERCFEDIHRIDDDSMDGNGIILVKRGDGEFYLFCSKCKREIFWKYTSDH